MKKIVALFCLLLLITTFLFSQNIGIGTSTPVMGKLEIKGVAGNGATVAAFGTESSGITLQRNWPTIGFNQYRDNTAGNGKFMSTGYAAIQFFDPGSGAMLIDMLGQGTTGSLTTSGVRAITILNNGNIGIRNNGGNASLWVSRGNNFEGTAVFSGTFHNSHFNYSTAENTYIRPGKDNGTVFINDVPGGKVSMGNGASRIGINTGIPAYTLDLFQAPGSGGIRLLSPDWYNTDWELRNDIYSNTNLTSCLAFRYNGALMGWFRPTDGGYSSNSDRRLKKDIISMEPVLGKLMKLEPARYHFINDASQRNCIGLIAQDVNALFPEVVDIRNVYDSTTKNAADWYGMNYAGLGVLAIKAIQEQQNIITQQQQQIDALTKRLDAIERKKNY